MIHIAQNRITQLFELWRIQQLVKGILYV